MENKDKIKARILELEKNLEERKIRLNELNQKTQTEAQQIIGITGALEELKKL